MHARIASSFISFEQAATNMKELGKDNIEQLAKKGKEAWNQVLGKIEVEGGNLDQYRTFYSCLYRSLLFPRKFYELDAAGKPIHYSPYNGQVLSGYPKILRNRPSVPIHDFSAFGKNCGKNGKNKNQ